MVDIPARLVMELRQKTGAKMMDAKRALEEADADMERAVAILREKGQADAAKRSTRITADGTITTAQAGNHGAAAMVELNCETDFVAKTAEFITLAGKLADYTLGQSAEAMTSETLPGDKLDTIKAAIAKTGENIQFRRGTRFASETGVVESYIHAGGKIGVLVQIDGVNNDEARALGKELAMQVAAAQPEFLGRESVPQSVIERELEIYRELARNEGKREEFLDRIAQGRLDKFYKESCLLDQAFIRDPDKTVKALIAEVAKAISAELTVKRFARYQLGQ